MGRFLVMGKVAERIILCDHPLADAGERALATFEGAVEVLVRVAGGGAFAD